ncbi:LuxR family transcriptional regulator [Maribius pontilimi]|uniref:LuxR family transcriptional regulator n=1 Tax=Palleronia pontilimi TaxID=1964209 RepID=A0A934IBA1_9RHOB|nr:LuxR family transcriptional regulator [Palleronia pontilimi]MBJ3763943.1 LuxR family transcriptional regulator [Palleronia pontilimi]
MKQRVLGRFIDRIETAKAIEAVEPILHDVRDALQLQHLLYHWINHEGELLGAGTYPSSWRNHYIAMDFARIDPVVKAAYQRFHPVNWAALDWSHKSVRQLTEDAHAAGIGPQGLTIPIRGPNGQFAHITATMNCDDAAWAAFSEENGRGLILLGHAINQKALELTGFNRDAPEVSLSPREIDALTFLAMGYSRAQTADTLSISEHTLRVYIESARAKMGSANVTHAVARALQLGLVVI